MIRFWRGQRVKIKLSMEAGVWKGNDSLNFRIRATDDQFLVLLGMTFMSCTETLQEQLKEFNLILLMRNALLVSAAA